MDSFIRNRLIPCLRAAAALIYSALEECLEMNRLDLFPNGGGQGCGKIGVIVIGCVWMEPTGGYAVE